MLNDLLGETVYLGSLAVVDVRIVPYDGFPNPLTRTNIGWESIARSCWVLEVRIPPALVACIWNEYTDTLRNLL